MYAKSSRFVPPDDDCIRFDWITSRPSHYSLRFMSFWYQHTNLLMSFRCFCIVTYPLSHGNKWLLVAWPCRSKQTKILQLVSNSVKIPKADFQLERCNLQINSEQHVTTNFIHINILNIAVQLKSSMLRFLLLGDHTPLFMEWHYCVTLKVPR
jgi:hypothetical protein